MKPGLSQSAQSATWTCMVMMLLLIGCVTTPEERLRQAATDGNLNQVDTLLNEGVPAHTADERGVTPLLMAAKNGHRDVAARLLEKGASVNQPRYDGVTPLLIAVQEGQLDIVTLFLEQGTNVNVRMPFVAGITLLHVAAHQGNRDIVLLLLKHGADKYARMMSGERPVDLARQHGHTELIPLLTP